MDIGLMHYDGVNSSSKFINSSKPPVPDWVLLITLKRWKLIIWW